MPDDLAAGAVVFNPFVPDARDAELDISMRTPDDPEYVPVELTRKPPPADLAHPPAGAPRPAPNRVFRLAWSTRSSGECSDGGAPFLWGLSRSDSPMDQPSQLRRAAISAATADEDLGGALRRFLRVTRNVNDVRAAINLLDDELATYSECVPAPRALELLRAASRTTAYQWVSPRRIDG
jgi:hypothetical protein